MGADYADTIAVDADDMRDDADAVFIRLARRSRRTLGASHDLPGSNLYHLPPHDTTNHHCLRTGSFKRDSGGVSQSGRRASCRIVGGQQVFLCLQSFFFDK